MAKRKRTNNDLQNIAQNTKDWWTRIPQKEGVNSGAPEGYTVPVPIGASVALRLLQMRWQIMNAERPDWDYDKRNILVTQIFHNVWPSHGGHCKTFETK